MAIAARATAACALAALLLALAASDSHAFLSFLGGSDDATTDVPVISTESSASTSAGRSRSSKNRGSRPHIEMSVLSSGHSGSHTRGSSKSRSSKYRSQSKANATIAIVPPPPKRVQEETTEPDPVETSPSQPAAPSGEQRATGSIYPPTVITETVRMEDGQMVAHVDVPAEDNGFRPISSLADLQARSPSDNQQPVWGPYPTELNSMPFDYSGMEQASFPYGQNSLPPWWQTRPFTTARNSWYPMPQTPYHPWRSSRLGLPPMMNPYTQMWLRGRGRRHTVLPDPFEAQDIAEDDSPDPGYGYFGNAYYGYSGWPPYTPPMRMYVPPYAYPWGPVTTRWVSKPFMGRVPQPSSVNAAGQPAQPSPSPSPPQTDTQIATGAEQQRNHNGAQHHPHHMRHSKHHMHAPMRLQPPMWLMPQVHHPRWPSVASLPQMLPMRPYMPSLPGASAGGVAPAAPAPSPPPSPPAADSEDPELYDD